MISPLLRRSALLVSLFSLLACPGERNCSHDGDNGARHIGDSIDELEVASRDTRKSIDEPAVLVRVKLDFVDPAGRGPTGQWPEGFPAYSTSADLVTNGTDGGLLSALNSAACTNGCVIEHPGNIGSVDLTRAGTTGGIVVRPPIGQRAQYNLSGTVNLTEDSIVVAGFALTGGLMLVQNGENSGFAWIEINGPGGIFGVYCYGVVSDGFFYEVLFRQYAAPGTGDRGFIRGNNNGRCDVLIVGSILTGTQDPPPQYHADTLQVNVDSGAIGLVTGRDSIIWPSYDKATQGQAGRLQFVFDNVYILAPGDANALWPGPGTVSLGGWYHSTAVSEFRNSTIVGPNYPDADIFVWDSELYSPGTWVDMGGNTVLNERPAPPRAPTHEELDAIWSP